jgi:PAS domain S-box-containing protein
VQTRWRAVGDQDRPREPAPLPSGLIADVGKSGSWRRLDAAPEMSSLLLEDLEQEGVFLQSVLATPLISAKRLEGVLVAGWRSAPPELDDEVVTMLAAQGANVLRLARLYEEGERERRQTEALAAAATAVSESLRLGEVRRLLLRHAVALLRSEGAMLAILEGRYLHCVAGVGSSSLLTGMHLPLEGSVAGRVVRDQRVAIVNDINAEPDAYRPVVRAAGIRNAVVVPLVTSRGVIGTLMANDREVPFDEEDARILQRLADQVAVAVVNARLFEEARQATQEWRVLFDAVPAGVVVLDDEGRVARYNARALELTGGDATRTLLGRSFGEAVLGRDAAVPLPDAVRQALETGATGREQVAVPARGQVLELQASAHPDGGAVVAFLDVTAVQEMEARLANLFENAPDAIYTLDPEGRVTSANPAACALAGVRPEDAIGQSIGLFMAPEDATIGWDGVRHALRGEPTGFEMRMRRADGEVRTVSVVNAPIRAGGAITGVLGIARDLTATKARDAALAASEARYERLVDAAGDAIFTVDEAGVLTSVNRVVERTLGLPRTAMLGRPFTVLLEGSPDRDVPWRVIADTLRGERRRTRFRYVDAQGAMRVGAMHTAPMVEDGRIVGALAVVRDVTDAQALAEREAARVSLLVHGLLAAARGDAPQLAATDLAPVLRDALDLRRAELERLGIELSAALPPTLPVIAADALQVQQAILNLLVNAEEALAGWDGARRLTVAATAEGDDLVIAVTDSGPGMAADVEARIFQPSFTTGVDGGPGLGLVVADGIVRRHGGRIEVRTAPGAGTTVRLRLPLTSAPHA